MLVGPEPLCRLIANCTQQLISSVALPSQKLAFAALQQEAEWAPFLRKTYQEKRDMCLKGLAADKRVETTVSEGTFYLFPNIERIGMTSDELAKHLLNRAGVAVTPGAVFGVAGEGHVRINMVGPNAQLDAGVKALIQGLPR
jgi:aspartate/methionine/tyrosine aminotransferase